MSGKSLINQLEDDVSSRRLVFSSGHILNDSLECIHEHVFFPGFIETYGLEQIRQIAREIWMFIALESRDRARHPMRILTLVIRELKRRPELRNLTGILSSLLPDPERLEALLGYLIQKTQHDLEALLVLLDNRSSMDATIKQTVAKEELELIDDLWAAQNWYSLCKKQMGSGQTECAIATGVQRFIHQLNHNTRSPETIQLFYMDPNGYLACSSLARFCQDNRIRPCHGRNQFAAGGPQETLWVGDSPQAMHDAKAAGIAFYPINPANPQESWQALAAEVWPAFVAGRYSGTWQTNLERAFIARFPLLAPWENLVHRNKAA